MTDLTFCAGKKATLSQIHFITLSLISKHTALQSKTASLGENIIETCYMQVTPHPVLTECKQGCSYSEAERSTFIYLETRGSEKDLLQNNMDMTCNMDTLTDISPSCSHTTASVRFREGLQGWNTCPDFYLGIYFKSETHKTAVILKSKQPVTVRNVFCVKCTRKVTRSSAITGGNAWSIIYLCRTSHTGFVNASRGFV